MKRFLLLCLTLAVLPGHVKRVYDGDTYFLYNIGIKNEQGVRELGMNAPELRDSLGTVARDSAEAWLHRGPYELKVCENDNFGRFLGTSYRGADTLSSWLIHLHLAVPCQRAPCPRLP
jgi:endonuclease YncB( thermonuclease family)